MRDAIISAASVLTLIVVSVCVGTLPFLGYHQTFMTTATEVTR